MYTYFTESSDCSFSSYIRSQYPPPRAREMKEASLRELGEADGVPVEGERGVDVLHEAVAEQPDIAAEADVLTRQGADALARAGRSLAEVKAVQKAVSSASAL